MWMPQKDSSAHGKFEAHFSTGKELGLEAVPAQPLDGTQSPDVIETEPGEESISPDNFIRYLRSCGLLPTPHPTLEFSYVFQIL